MVDGKDLFSHFREHSVAEFFKKNKQMLGFSGKVRSLTTIVHEAVSNSLDACEEAGIVPEIKVEVKELGEYHYSVKIEDNGSGIPKSHLGKALGQMLAGTKFHRYVQQRGQQGIGIAAVSMYALLTTAQHPHAISYYKDKKISCEISMDFKTNKAELLNLIEEDNKEGKHGLTYEAEFKDVEYKKSDQGIFEYLRRTALANPHAQITLTEPNNETIVFPRAIQENPPRPKEILPHPLGVGAHDLLDLARAQKENRKISAFLQNALARLSANKVSELREIVKDVDFDKNPADLTWEEAEKIVQGFKQVKWIAPETDSIVPIGKEQIEKSFMNIFNPEVLAVTERSPKVYQGGVPFAIEAAIAFGGGIATAGKKGEIMRFANRVPLLFDAGGCALTEATKSVDWGRYNLKQFEEEPIVVLINFVSVYVPYTGAGKQAVAQEEDIMDEIKNAVMEAAREVQKYISGKKKAHEIETKRKVISRYIEQLASDVTDLAAAKNKNEIKKKLEKIIEEKYSQGGEGEEEKEDIPEHEEERVKEDDESEEE
ncbi:DNA topoisomerase VI subunit B [Candidatus Micrarchaeota archaeon]|nr:DNA topoisomerase VI subunit B [Candidatus Micrarchaeota archaeon]